MGCGLGCGCGLWCELGCGCGLGLGLGLGLGSGLPKSEPYSLSLPPTPNAIPNQTLPSLAGIRLVELALGATHAVARAEDGAVYTLGACLPACGHEGEHGFEYLG